jgi:hypothetical protein
VARIPEVVSYHNNLYTSPTTLLLQDLWPVGVAMDIDDARPDVPGTVSDPVLADAGATDAALLPRRSVLAAGGAAGLGMTALVLPGAIAAASGPGTGGTVADEGSSEALATGANSTINAVLVRTNSPEQVIIGGSFTSYGGIGLGASGPEGPKTRLLALTTSGEIDTATSATFPQLNVVPHGLYEHTRLIGGTADRGLLILHNTTENGTTPSATEEEYSGRFLIRLKNDGSLDTAFNANVPLMGRTHKSATAPESNSQFNTIALFSRPVKAVVRTDGTNAGKILLVGGFNEVADPVNAQATLKQSTRLKRFGLLQLNADGTLDTAFAPDWGDNSDDLFSASTIRYPDGTDVTVGADGDIIFTGRASSFQGVVVGPTERRFIILASGSTGQRIATTFNDTYASETFEEQSPLPADAVAVTSDGSLIVVGRELEGFVGPTADGRDDSSWTSLRCFAPTSEGASAYALQSSLTTFAPRSDGRATASEFERVTGLAPRLFRVGTDSFVLTVNDGDTERNRHFRVTYVAEADPSLTVVNLGAGTALPNSSSPTVLGFAPLRSGRLVAVGSFTTINGVARNRIAFLEPNGGVTPID